MVRALVVVVIACGACGRIGFVPPPGPDGGGPDTAVAPITVTIFGDADAPDQGMPVADAIVLFESSDGTVTELRSDAQGTAVVVATEPMVVSVARLEEAGVPATWSLRTFVDVPAGTTLTLGAPAPISPTEMFTLSVPAYSGAVTYGATAAIDCGIDAQGGALMVIAAYSSACTGKTVDVYARATDGSSLLVAWQRVPVALSPGVTATAGAWQPPAMRTLTYAGFAVGDQVQSQFLLDDADGLVALDYNTTSDQITAPGPLTISRPTIGVTPSFVLAIVVTMPRFLIAGVTFPLPANTLDASTLPPPIDSVTASPATRETSWSVDLAHPASPEVMVTGTTLVQPDATLIEWLAYAPAPRERVAFPKLPATLAAIDPVAATAWTAGVGLGVARTDADYAAIIASLDGELPGLVLAAAHPGASITVLALETAITRARRSRSARLSAPR